MKIPSLRFAADVPDHWLDRSSFAFLVPPDGSIAEPRAKQPKEPTPPASVVIQWREPPANMTSLGDFLEAQIPEMQAAFAGLVVVERGDDGTDEEPAPFLDCRLPGNQPLRQLIVARLVQGQLVLLTGTAQELQFASMKKHFLAVVKSMRPAA